MPRNPDTGKFEKPGDEPLPTTILAAALLPPEPPDDNEKRTSESDPLRASLLELIQADLGDRRAKKSKEEDELRRLMIARTQGFKEEKERRDLMQAYCHHRKENMRPNIGGQRLSNGHTVFICGTCYKTFDETNLPPTLQVDLQNIGG